MDASKPVELLGTTYTSAPTAFNPCTNKETQDQMLAVMLFHGTAEQQRQALSQISHGVHYIRKTE